MNNHPSSNVLSPMADRPQMHRITLIAMGVIALFAVGMNISRADTPIAPPGVTAQPSTAPGMQHRMNSEKMAKMRERRKAHVEQELDTMSNRLEITASEQPVWDQYKAARLGLLPDKMPGMKPSMNAADRAQMRAERAEQMAKKMAVLSTATTQLRAALAPNQQQVLDEMAQHWRGKMSHHRPGDERGFKHS
ncbi:MAG: hypothetical protein B7Y07_01460 [Halothiobacillus sp. 24-54-40]|nr:MAG: hypothetical protein B7Y58_01215 [Halothiobacillus sp. 35-54-62]OYZ88130.1 MAG: hypothetical protein B7Y07_01460 [Halothiobacillus sp. 24-54-40]OZA81618.1 MAG: hypothetical protein B7X64_00710 [Halothiobacillus sp. 39-53-45]HQS02228.1 hypothetical protein [Halothiobacillus sp.]HQS29131.1 hypothetical protein [Halothiobacillus sp.]